MIHQEILISNGFIEIPHATETHDHPVKADIATVMSNLANYGYTLDRQAFDALFSVENLGSWWKSIEPSIKRITGADRKIGDFVVYRNFPREVLDMDVATSVFRQILIYFGIPYDMVREDEKVRPPLGELSKLKVLTFSGEQTADKIFTDLMVLPNRWSDNQTLWAKSLLGDRNCIVFGDFAFKENAITLAAEYFDKKEFEVSSGTDVLRLCAALSKADVSLREKVKLRSFKRAERRRLLSALETQTNLAEDMATRPEVWKRLLERLRPGDYSSFTNVQTAYDRLYNKRVKPFSAIIDPQKPTLETLEAATARPGEFLRRFHHFYNQFGRQAVDAMLPIMDRLTTRQLVNFRSYLRTINTRTTMIYAPKSNWSRAQIALKNKMDIVLRDRLDLDNHIGGILATRLAKAFPEGIALDLRVDQIKLQSNDQKLAEYGRGTSFDIPANINFVRSASYWASTNSSTVWFDNGWNFFDENWKSMGACAWNNQHFSDGNAAIFSGDPVNIRDLKGRACQMIDLNLDLLRDDGVRYAVWSILCYSRIKFSEAIEVLATLQMGEQAETGQLYEPSRAQMVFPITSATLTNYVAYIDLKTRKLIYMDAALPGRVESAGANDEKLQELMPAYVEYLESQPSVFELLQDAPVGKLPVLFDDDHVKIKEGRAFVFRPHDKENVYERVSVADLVKTSSD